MGKYKDIDSTQQNIRLFGSSKSNNRSGFYIRSRNGRRNLWSFAVVTGDIEQTEVSELKTNKSVLLNKWTHVSATYKDLNNGTFEQKFYVDGKLIGNPLITTTRRFVRPYASKTEASMASFNYNYTGTAALETNQYVNVHYKDGLRTNTYSLSIWFRPGVTGQTNGHDELLSFRDVSGRYVYGLKYDRSTNGKVVFTGGNWEYYHHDDKLISDNKIKIASNSSIASFKNESYVVVWAEQSSIFKNGNDIYAKRITSTGSDIIAPVYPTNTNDLAINEGYTIFERTSSVDNSFNKQTLAYFSPNSSETYLKMSNSSILNTLDFSISIWVYDTDTRYPTTDVINTIVCNGSSTFGSIPNVGSYVTNSSGGYRIQIFGTQEHYPNKFLRIQVIPFTNEDTKIVFTSQIDSSHDFSHKWKHIVFTYNSSTKQLELYIDGVSQLLTYQNYYGDSEDLTSIDGDYAIGNNIFSGPTGESFYGHLFDFRYYRRNLTQQEITNLFTSSQFSYGETVRLPMRTINVDEIEQIGNVVITKHGLFTPRTVTLPKSIDNTQKLMVINPVAEFSSKDYIEISDATTLNSSAFTATFWLQYTEYPETFINSAIDKTTTLFAGTHIFGDDVKEILWSGVQGEPNVNLDSNIFNHIDSYVNHNISKYQYAMIDVESSAQLDTSFYSGGVFTTGDADNDVYLEFDIKSSDISTLTDNLRMFLMCDVSSGSIFEYPPIGNDSYSNVNVTHEGTITNTDCVVLSDTGDSNFDGKYYIQSNPQVQITFTPYVTIPASTVYRFKSEWSNSIFDNNMILDMHETYTDNIYAQENSTVGAQSHSDNYNWPDNYGVYKADTVSLFTYGYNGVLNFTTTTNVTSYTAPDINSRLGETYQEGVKVDGKWSSRGANIQEIILLIFRK